MSPDPSGSRDGERETIIRTLTQLVTSLSDSLPDTEVVVHDLSKLPDSIVAISGTLTSRGPGDPATDLLLEQASAGRLETLVGYQSVLPDGRGVRSTTIAVADGSGEPVAALCINSDVAAWQALSTVVAQMVGEAHPPQESFVHDVDELATVLLTRAIESQRVPVSLMRKSQKLEVVRAVRAGGIFMLRDAAETVARALQVTRFTVYNYLKEIEQQESDHPEEGEA